MIWEGKIIRAFHQYLLCYCWLSFPLIFNRLSIFDRDCRRICLPHRALLFHAMLFLQEWPCAFIYPCLLIFFLQDWNRTQQISWWPHLPFAPVEGRSIPVFYTGYLHALSITQCWNPITMVTGYLPLAQPLDAYPVYWVYFPDNMSKVVNFGKYKK